MYVIICIHFFLDTASKLILDRYKHVFVKPPDDEDLRVDGAIPLVRLITIGGGGTSVSNIGFTRFHTYPGYVLASKFWTRTLGSRMIAECRCGFRFSTDRTGWKPCKWPKTSNVPHVRQMFLSRMYFVFGRGIENRWIS